MLVCYDSQAILKAVCLLLQKALESLQGDESIKNNGHQETGQETAYDFDLGRYAVHIAPRTEILPTEGHRGSLMKDIAKTLCEWLSDCDRLFCIRLVLFWR